MRSGRRRQCVGMGEHPASDGYRVGPGTEINPQTLRHTHRRPRKSAASIRLSSDKFAHYLLCNAAHMTAIGGYHGMRGLFV
jgi:hypothetical protein